MAHMQGANLLIRSHVALYIRMLTRAIWSSVSWSTDTLTCRQEDQTTDVLIGGRPALRLIKCITGHWIWHLSIASSSGSATFDSFTVLQSPDSVYILRRNTALSFFAQYLHFLPFFRANNWRCMLKPRLCDNGTNWSLLYGFHCSLSNKRVQVKEIKWDECHVNMKLQPAAD